MDNKTTEKIATGIIAAMLAILLGVIVVLIVTDEPTTTRYELTDPGY